MEISLYHWILESLFEREVNLALREYSDLPYHTYLVLLIYS